MAEGGCIAASFGAPRMPYRGAVAVTHRRKPKVRRRGVLTKAIVRLRKAIPPLRMLVPDASRQACLREFTVDISAASIVSRINAMTRRTAFGTCGISALLGQSQARLPALPRDRLANDKVGL